MSIFTKIQIKKPKRSAFNLSHEKKLSFNMGELIPTFLQEVVPGDKFQIRTENLVRFQALQSPLMHRVNVTQHFFFVPYRLVWSQWEDFITGGEDGTANPVFPTLSLSSGSSHKTMLGVGTLADYLGFPSLNVENGIEIEDFNALPFRAYQLIYNEFYRDQNLTDPVPISKSSGNVELSGNITNYQGNIWRLRRRAWQKDYFTSALPWAQRGPEVSIANQEQLLPVKAGQHDLKLRNALDRQQMYDVTGKDMTGVTDLDDQDMYVNSPSSIHTINELRTAYRLQEWLEKNARGGARYIEQILSHFGVKSSDSRLQRPEFLGGNVSPVVISEVLQHSATGNDGSLGTMGGHGVSASGMKPIKKFFEEHGLVLGIMSVTPDPAYMQGLPRLFSKFDKFDYYWPEFAHLGEQEIKNKELYYDPADPTNDSTFGYTPRYAEYRSAQSTVHGDMLTSLDFWHLAMKFDSRPNLNKTFIECDPRRNIFAITDPSQDMLIAQVYHDFKAIRPMPKYATPII